MEKIISLEEFSAKENHGTPKWHYAMLNDMDRNRAIRNSIIDLDLDDKVVWEIGAGSGLFSILFIKYGAKKVYTCEMDPVMADIAQETIDSSGYGEKIQLFLGSSTEFLETKNGNFNPDIIFTETLDCGVIGEGFIKVKKDIMSIIKPSTYILPGCIRQLGSLVSSVNIFGLNYVDEFSQIDLRALNKINTKTYFPVRSELYQKQYLSNTCLINTYDYKTNKEIDDSFEIEINQSGLCHGLLSYFIIEFGNHEVSSQEGIGSHWHQAFHPFKHPIYMRCGEIYRMSISDSGNISILEKDSRGVSEQYVLRVY